MLELGWIQKDPEEARKFALTDLGIREFLKLGVNPYDAWRPVGRVSAIS